MTEEEKQQNEETTAEETPEEAPKRPRRTRRKKAEAEESTADSAQSTDEEAAEEPVAEAAEAVVEADEAAEEEAEPEAAEEDEEEVKPSRRRRSSETAAPAPAQKKAPAPRAADGTVVVRAQAKYVRHAPRKARLVVDHIRGKSIDEARAILQHTPRAAAVDVLKLLESAVANAENNHELVADELFVRKVYVDEGPTLKRYRPRALGRATRIRKRTSHMTIQLSPKE
jgi:ribosomal protein L22